jgi:HD domain
VTVRRDRSVRRTAPLIVGVAGLVVVAALVDTVVRGVTSPQHALAFTVLIALGEFVRIILPGGREAAPLGAAGAIAYALLPTVPGVTTDHSVAQVVTVTVVGIVLGGLPHALVGRAPQLDYVTRRILSIALAAALFRPLVEDTALVDLSIGPGLALVMVAILVVTGVFDAALAAGTRVAEDGAPFRAALRDELRALIGISSAIGASGVLIALTTGVMGLWAIPVFCLPLLLAQFSFRRYAAIRATYLQTVRALSRVTELGGYTDTGHARRVSELAVAVGRDLGLTEEELLDLEYAALMHDIGQLSLADPIPGGATIMVERAEQRRIAQMGAEVIRQTGVLDSVAAIVESQADAYRQADKAEPPMASRIIKAVNAMEDLVGGSVERQRRLDALEQLRIAIQEYDPAVVEALSRVVDRGARYA